MEMSRTKNSDLLDVFTQFFIVFSALSYSLEVLNRAILLIISVILLSFVIFKRILKNQAFTIYRIDIWWILFILIFIFNRDSNYATFASYFLVLGLISMFVFRENTRGFLGAFIAILSFSTINLFMNLLNIFSLSHFITITDVLKISIFNDWSSSITGLSSDIGRNAYTSITGFSVAFALLFSKLEKYRIILWIFLMIMFLFVIFSGKLGHSVFLLVSIMFLIMYLEKSTVKRFRKILLVIFSVIIFIGVTYLLFPQTDILINRILAKLAKGDISSGRVNLWRIAFSIFLKNPVWGIGYGGFTVNSLYYTDIAIYAGVHNDYLQWLAETGLIGFSINLSLLLGVYLLSLQVLRKLISHKYTFEKSLIIWSVLFQTFIIFYSFSGLPHFFYDTNIVYLISCSVPYAIMKQNRDSLFRKNVLIKVRIFKRDLADEF